MPLRLNYTGRKRLNLSEVGIQIHPDANGAATFDAALDLTSIRPNADAAKVFIEAYYQSTKMRFDFGTVASVVTPPLEDRRLVEFDRWQQILFRVKVTDTTQVHGKLLAWRNQIRPKGPVKSPERDLVHFINADLDGLVWSIEFDGAVPVVVCIDRRAGDCHDVGSDPKFQSAVYPEILRRTLTYAFVDQKYDGDDEEHWSHQWLEGFLRPQLGVAEPPPLEDDAPTAREEWIDSAVRRFAKKNKLNQLWNPLVQENE